MANQEQLTLLQQEEMETWNRWRLAHPDLLLDLDGADLSEWSLGERNLSYARLRGANLTRTDLNHANLSHALLNGANLSEVNLASANISEADLSGAIMRNAYLRGANLNGVLLTTEQVKQAQAAEPRC